MAEKVHRIRRRRQYLNEGAHAARRHLEAIVQAQGEGTRAGGHPAVDARDVDRAGVHGASDRIDAPHDSAQAAEDRAVAARRDWACRARLPRRASIWDRIRGEITSGWQTAENSRERLDGRRRARARPVLHRRSAVSDRADLLRGDRSARWSRSMARTRATSSCPRSCGSARGWAATWTAIPTCMRRRSARPLRVISRSSSINYFLECQGLAETLSQSAARIGVSSELQARIEQYMVLLPAARQSVARAARSHAVSRVSRSDDGAAARDLRGARQSVRDRQ